MTKVTEPFAAAPQLMKQWMAVSLAVQDSLCLLYTSRCV